MTQMTQIEHAERRLDSPRTHRVRRVAPAGAAGRTGARDARRKCEAGSFSASHFRRASRALPPRSGGQRVRLCASVSLWLFDPGRRAQAKERGTQKKRVFAMLLVSA